MFVDPIEVVSDPDVDAGKRRFGASDAPRGDARLGPRPTFGTALKRSSAVTLGKRAESRNIWPNGRRPKTLK